LKRERERERERERKGREGNVAIVKQTVVFNSRKKEGEQGVFLIRDI